MHNYVNKQYYIEISVLSHLTRCITRDKLTLIYAHEQEKWTMVCRCTVRQMVSKVTVEHYRLQWWQTQGSLLSFPDSNHILFRNSCWKGLLCWCIPLHHIRHLLLPWQKVCSSLILTVWFDNLSCKWL